MACWEMYRGKMYAIINQNEIMNEKKENMQKKLRERHNKRDAITLFIDSGVIYCLWE